MKKFTLFLLLLLISGLSFAQFSGGKGTRMAPFLVANANDLNNVRNYPGSYFIQTANIDLEAVENWEPIGNEGTFEAFTGFYNGADFTISNLRIYRPGESNVGLFGYVGPGTSSKPVVIRNVHLKEVNVLGGFGTGSLVGTVMGNFYTLIENCTATGQRGSRSVVGEACTGGLVGINHGVEPGDFPGGANNSIISKCSVDLDVIFAGVMPENGGTPVDFGGLVGRNMRGIILDSYACGMVSVNSDGVCTAYNVGGLAGNNGRFGVIERSFSVCEITGTAVQNMNGLVGANCLNNGNCMGTVINSFWDTDVSGIAYSPVGIGLTSEQMKDPSNYCGFSFGRIWKIDANNNGYPSLRRVAGNSYITWNGKLSNNWNQPGNWDEGRIPGRGDMVVIPDACPHYPLITTEIADMGAPESISVMLRANITISPIGSLTVSGTFQNNAGEAGLVILSDATGTGSLIQGSGDLHAVINRFMCAADQHADGRGWHLISSPVEDQAIDDGWIPQGGGNNYVFYKFDESAAPEYWLSQKNAANHINEFIPGSGYFIGYQTDNVKNFSGVVNSKPISMTNLSYTPNSSYAGFHLVGNPFPCSIDWNSGGWEKNNIPESSMYIWNHSTASFMTVAETGGIIPAMHGFMVYTTGNGELTIPLDARGHKRSASYNKNSEEFIQLSAVDVAGNTSQSSIIRFNLQATAGFDEEFDAHFLPGYAPMFYSRSWDAFLALNTLEKIDDELCIHFGFVKNESELYRIELEKTIPGATIYLTDRKENKVVNLSQLRVYTFISEEGDDADRFLVHFAPLSTNNLFADNTIRVAVIDGVICLSGLPEKAELRLTALSGQTVKQLSTGGNTSVNINTGGLASGVYVISVATGNGIFTRKIVL